MTYEPQAWPRWMHKADGSGRVFDAPEDVPHGEGWMTRDQLNALDGDGNGAMGGSTEGKRRKASKAPAA